MCNPIWGWTATDCATRFALAAARIRPGDLPIPYNFGFLVMNLGTVFAPGPDPYGPENQAHVTVNNTAEGRFAGAQAAWPLPWPATFNVEGY
jgi:hypothetical protein